MIPDPPHHSEACLKWFDSKSHPIRALLISADVFWPIILIGIMGATAVFYPPVFVAMVLFCFVLLAWWMAKQPEA